MKKYKIVHKITADFIAEAIVNEDEIDTSINDLKEYKKPNSKFNYTMLKGTESVTQTNYELYDEKPNNSIKNELATNDIRPIHLITIGFSTPVNITDCSFSLTSSVSGSSVTYNASDHLIGISDFAEQIDVSKSSIKLSLSGAEQTYISAVLNENVTNDEVTIYRGLLEMIIQ
jgi:hypothetical protein